MQALSIGGLRKTYPNGLQALSEVNIGVAEGDFFGLLGPNGAGKSTLIGIVSSLVRKSAGTVEVFGCGLDEQPELVRSMIGLVPQEFNFNQFEPIGEILVNQAGYYGIPARMAWKRAEFLLRRLDLWKRHRDQSRSLSGGMKRRLLIARSLIHEPRMLILDEPTAGVDIEIRHSLWDFLRELNSQGMTIILTTHYLEEAESLCKNLGIIQEGRILLQSSIRNLVSELNIEHFVLNIRQPLPLVCELAPFSYQQIDDGTLEVAVRKDQNLNELFAVLSQQGIEVLSLRNTRNRLEQLLMNLLKHGREAIASS